MESKPYHHGNLYTELIEEGIELICKEGMANFSLRKLAKQVGISPTACYNHFANKEDLVEKMKEYTNASFASTLREAAKNPGSHSKSVAIGRAYVEYFAAHPHYMQFIYDNEDYSIDLTEKDLTGDYEAFQIFREIALQEDYMQMLPDEMRRDVLLAMWGMVQGLATMANMKGFHYDGDWGELAERILANYTIDTN